MQNSIVNSSPNLIESNTRYYLSDILHKCHDNRAKLYIYSLNTAIFVLFVVVTTLILYFCYKSKKTPEEIKKRELEDQAYILSKIRHYKQERQNIASRATITGLPLVGEY